MELHKLPWKFVKVSMEVDLNPWTLVELTSMEITMEVIFFPWK